MKCIAIQRGYDGTSVRDPEELDPYTKAPAIFEMPDGAKGTWFVECDDEGRPLVELKKTKPVKNKEIPGAGPAKGSQLEKPVDRQYPKGQEPTDLA